MGYLKGKSALMVFDRFPQMKQGRGRHLWAREYYVSTVGVNKALPRVPGVHAIDTSPFLECNG